MVFCLTGWSDLESVIIPGLQNTEKRFKLHNLVNIMQQSLYGAFSRKKNVNFFLWIVTDRKHLKVKG